MITIIDRTLFANLAEREAASSVSELVRGNISWDLRGSIFDWLAEVHDRLKLPPDVLWHAYDCFHRYLASGRNLDHNAFLSGLTCLWVAAKYEDCERLRLRKIARFIAEGKDVRKRMILEERSLLDALQFRLSAHTAPTFWIEYICVSCALPFPHKRLARIILDGIAAEPWFGTVPSKTMAATTTFIAMKMCGTQWTNSNITYSGLEEQGIVPYAQQVLLYLRSDDYTATWMFKKHARAEYGGLAHRVRDWAFCNDI